MYAMLQATNSTFKVGCAKNFAVVAVGGFQGDVVTADSGLLRVSCGLFHVSR
jgi:hypothetical protein